jgi:hypothetical protein
LLNDYQSVGFGLLGIGGGVPGMKRITSDSPTLWFSKPTGEIRWGGAARYEKVTAGGLFETKQTILEIAASFVLLQASIKVNYIETFGI